MKYTIFGSSGFIGSHLTRYLRSLGYSVHLPSRQDLFTETKDLGRVIYCIGLTGDFRSRPFDTIEANVGIISKVIRECSFDSLVYLSSTRVYGVETCHLETSEESRLSVVPSNDSLYDLSKLLAEALCSSQHSRNIRVARVSNVVGNGLSTATFLGSLAESIKLGSPIVIKEGENSRKDYVCIADVVSAIYLLSKDAKNTIYNVASNSTATHKEIATIIEEELGHKVSFFEAAIDRVLPKIDTTEIQREFPHLHFKSASLAIRNYFRNLQKEYSFGLDK